VTTQDAGAFILRDAADQADLFDTELAATLRDMALDYAGPYGEGGESDLR
jgi:hypothetical protein